VVLKHPGPRDSIREGSGCDDVLALVVAFAGILIRQPQRGAFVTTALSPRCSDSAGPSGQRRAFARRNNSAPVAFDFLSENPETMRHPATGFSCSSGDGGFSPMVSASFWQVRRLGSRAAARAASVPADYRAAIEFPARFRTIPGPLISRAARCFRRKLVPKSAFPPAATPAVGHTKRRIGLIVSRSQVLALPRSWPCVLVGL